MDQKILENLKEWRIQIAEQEGVPVYRVFNNETLEAVALLKPSAMEELLAIKGIREKKLAKYGNDLLKIVNGGKSAGHLGLSSKLDEKQDKPYRVSDYLNLVNNNLRKQGARVMGEISSLDIRGSYLFFGLKDKNDESLLNCFMWARDYRLSGIEFDQGMEIIVQGFPEVYKPNGRFSLQVRTAELIGEGALKKAYLALKESMEKEGLFSSDRKKPFPDFVQKVGLITSQTGAVIHDFLNNLGKYGYQIRFYASRVEGQAAVHDLQAGLDYFQDKDIDVLVLIRGGGSLESLQAFNNETLVRKIANFNKPLVCGIGHDKDIPLACLTADLMVSTPTAVSVVLNKSWEGSIENIRLFERDIIYRFQELLSRQRRQIEISTQQLKDCSLFVFQKINQLENQLKEKMNKLDYALAVVKNRLKNYTDSFLMAWQRDFRQVKEYLMGAKQKIRFFDPRRQLKLGYSIVSLNQKIIKSAAGVKKGVKLDIRVSDGKIKSKVEEVIKK